MPHGSSLSGWFFLVATALYGFICLLGSWTAFRNPRRAAVLFLTAVPAWGSLLLWLAYRAFVLTDGFILLPLVLLITSIPTALGLFWFFTHRLSWPVLIADRRRSSARKAWSTLAVGFLLLMIVAMGAAGLELWRTGKYLDCGESPPFVKRQYSDQNVFVAKVAYASKHLWAIGLVQERFWGLRWWEHRIVFLLVGSLKPGERYFIEGRHWSGLLTQFFPVISYTPCGHSSLLKDSFEIRLLQDGVRKDGVRIIGRVERFPGFGQTVSNVGVLISSPEASIATTTDAQGIYDVAGLPPGRYRIRVAPPNATQSRCRESTELEPGDVWGCTLSVTGN